MSQHESDESRRHFLKIAAGTAAAAVVLAAMPKRAAAAGLPHLSPSAPQAQALGYVDNTAQADQAKFPNHKINQFCGDCAFYQGTATEQWGPCQLFPGNAVHVKGWCSAHKMKK